VKLWLIYQDQNNDYDTYDSAVVAADTEDAARRTVPGKEFGDYDWTSTGLLLVKTWGSKEMMIADGYTSWITDLSHVQIDYLGEAVEGTEAGVVCASFNAG
jgi:hypothetical protein